MRPNTPTRGTHAHASFGNKNNQRRHKHGTGWNNHHSYSSPGPNSHPFGGDQRSGVQTYPHNSSNNQQHRNFPHRIQDPVLPVASYGIRDPVPPVVLTAYPPVAPKPEQGGGAGPTKKPKVNKDVCSAILDLMIQHGDEYLKDHVPEDAFFEMIAGLVQDSPTTKGFNGNDIKTKVHRSLVCRERREALAKMDAKNELERRVDAWNAIVSRRSAAFAGTAHQTHVISEEIEPLDRQTVDALTRAATGTLERNYRVLEGSGASRSEWQRAELMVGLPLVAAANPGFLTQRQENTVLTYIRKSIPLLQGGQPPPRQDGGARATSLADPPHGRSAQAAAANAGPSAPRGSIPVVDLRSPSPPPRKRAAEADASGGVPRKRKKRDRRDAGARETTAGVQARDHEEVVMMAHLAAKIKKEKAELDRKLSKSKKHKEKKRG